MRAAHRAWPPEGLLRFAVQEPALALLRPLPSDIGATSQDFSFGMQADRSEDFPADLRIEPRSGRIDLLPTPDQGAL